MKMRITPKKMETIYPEKIKSINNILTALEKEHQRYCDYFITYEPLDEEKTKYFIENQEKIIKKNVLSPLEHHEICLGEGIRSLETHIQKTISNINKNFQIFKNITQREGLFLEYYVEFINQTTNSIKALSRFYQEREQFLLQIKEKLPQEAYCTIEVNSIEPLDLDIIFSPNNRIEKSFENSLYKEVFRSFKFEYLPNYIQDTKILIEQSNYLLKNYDTYSVSAFMSHLYKIKNLKELLSQNTYLFFEFIEEMSNYSFFKVETSLDKLHQSLSQNIPTLHKLGEIISKKLQQKHPHIHMKDIKIISHISNGEMSIKEAMNISKPSLSSILQKNFNKAEQIIKELSLNKVHNYKTTIPLSLSLGIDESRVRDFWRKWTKAYLSKLSTGEFKGPYLIKPSRMKHIQTREILALNIINDNNFGSLPSIFSKENSNNIKKPYLLGPLRLKLESFPVDIEIYMTAEIILTISNIFKDQLNLLECA